MPPNSGATLIYESIGFAIAIILPPLAYALAALGRYCLDRLKGDEPFRRSQLAWAAHTARAIMYGQSLNIAFLGFRRAGFPQASSFFDLILPTKLAAIVSLVFWFLIASVVYYVGQELVEVAKRIGRVLDDSETKST